ncbi:MAG: 50S ribosomal protein L28 [Planctomycetota bacterium]
MSKRCEICGKGPQPGNNVQSRGQPKSKGGVGVKQTGRSKRRFNPNLQRIWAVIDGQKKRIRACTQCIKSGKVTKPAR